VFTIWENFFAQNLTNEYLSTKAKRDEILAKSHLKATESLVLSLQKFEAQQKSLVEKYSLDAVRADLENKFFTSYYKRENNTIKAQMD
jgi:hypothetical protein